MQRILLCLFLLLGAAAGSESKCQDFRRRAPGALWMSVLGFSAGRGPCGVPLNVSGSLSGYPWNPWLPVVVILHGRRPPKVRPRWVGVMAQELLSAHRLNVLAIDWLAPGNQNLLTAATQAGKLLAGLLRSLLAKGFSATSLHLIGFGTGAHIAGIAGSRLRGSIGRITGLDPFGPSFLHTGPRTRLDYTDAQFVDVVHTNYRANEPIAALGLRPPMGHVDFYVGKGYQLPGCPKSLLDRERYVLCNHQKAYQLFTSSIRAGCPLTAFPCRSLRSFTRGRCTRCHRPGLRSCPELGYNTSWLTADRPVPFKKLTAFLDISSSPPHCVTYFLLELQIGGTRSLRCLLFVKLKGRGVETSALRLSHSAVTLTPGKVYQFLVPADRDGEFNSLLLELYTSRFLLLEWRRRRVHIDGLTLTRLPRDNGTVYFANDIEAAEGRTEHIPLTKEEELSTILSS
ncbi:lipase member H-like [Huso huso]|uniref:Phospholipase A1 member A n=1 Tax=Huso huso TaxID=61971 RepID=A0ABR0Y616_HUSHU